MMTIIKNGFRINVPCNQSIYSDHIAGLYDSLNLNIFPNVLELPGSFRDFIDHIYSSGKLDLPKINDIQFPETALSTKNPRHVLLGFSGGLDSVAQALYLRDQGHIVHLFELRNVNTYENGLGHKATVKCAEKMNMELIEANIIKTTDKTNPYKQTLPENPIKNQLILALMIDICIENGWNKISLGDDFDLGIKDAVFGINLTDARELTQTFLSGISNFCKNIEFLIIDSKKHNKFDRLMTLADNDLLDYYYSCVSAGRFNQSTRKRIQKKFNVDLFANNCGSCRKCCMHNLLLHYKNKKNFSQEYIDFCWKKMYDNGYSADYEFFRPELSLEQRLENLYAY